MEPDRASSLKAGLLASKPFKGNWVAQYSDFVQGLWKFFKTVSVVANQVFVIQKLKSRELGNNLYSAA